MVDFTRRDIATLGIMAAGVTLAPSRAAATRSPGAALADPIQYVNPELRPAWLGLRQWTSNAGKPGASPAPPGMAIPRMGPDWMPRKIAGRGGAPDVGILVHGARAGTSRPAILHIHGGGYTGGSPMISMGSLQAIADAMDCVIVTVDYRLAPATRFPGALEDNYAALLWMHGQASDLGIDRSRIAVLGESAGGGHAAMLAIAARDRGEVTLAFQALIYPMIDDRTGSNGWMPPPYIDVVSWTPANNAQGWTALLGVPAGSSVLPKGSVPARITDVSGLPPTYIAVGSIDIFVNENIAYAQRLIDAGIPVELNVVPGAFHGFDIFASETGLAKRFRARLVDALGAAFRKA
ncbi:alpha/beta hydrolase [Sphingobium sufflavum]|uniref:alpha/beta hydrolase n=1 Tax=Sphingobium sufflavum TaxID=1129547 RepID=UPI001F3B950A|nr:alpha/beta hydrolase [Sphingobium sufflavum]MCE7797144.1 alpha/beta hydrolase [Sphingobium sufflavum]